MSWDDRFIDLARTVAGWSKDPSTQVGCVIADRRHNVLSLGFNGLPRGVGDHREANADRYERPAKYLWTSHAEENAVAQAASSGHRLLEGIAYITHPPCCRCARMLIQAGVRRVIHAEGVTSMPDEEFRIAREMFSEASVSVTVRQ